MVMILHCMELLYKSPRGKKQLSMQEGECSQIISKVRIHIERVIGLLKNKYTILQGTLPIVINGSESAYVDQILIACAALTNLSPSIVIDED